MGVVGALLQDVPPNINNIINRSTAGVSQPLVPSLKDLNAALERLSAPLDPVSESLNSAVASASASASAFGDSLPVVPTSVALPENARAHFSFVRGNSWNSFVDNSFDIENFWKLDPLHQHGLDIGTKHTFLRAFQDELEATDKSIGGSC